MHSLEFVQLEYHSKTKRGTPCRSRALPGKRRCKYAKEPALGHAHRKVGHGCRRPCASGGQSAKVAKHLDDFPKSDARAHCSNRTRLTHVRGVALQAPIHPHWQDSWHLRASSKVRCNFERRTDTALQLLEPRSRWTRSRHALTLKPDQSGLADQSGV